MPPAGRVAGSPSHTPRGWGFSGEAELGVCASVPLQDCSPTMEPEKAACTAACSVGELAYVHARVCVCVSMQVCAHVFAHACADGCDVRFSIHVYCYFV